MFVVKATYCHVLGMSRDKQLHVVFGFNDYLLNALSYTLKYNYLHLVSGPILSTNSGLSLSVLFVSRYSCWISNLQSLGQCWTSLCRGLSNRLGDTVFNSSLLRNEPSVITEMLYRV
jgi:hypothetical protein